MRSSHVPMPALAAALLIVLPAFAETRVVLPGLRMDPGDADARDYSRPGFGVAAEAVAPLPVPEQLVAGCSASTT